MNRDKVRQVGTARVLSERRGLPKLSTTWATPSASLLNSGPQHDRLVLTIRCAETGCRVEISCIARARPRFFGCREALVPQRLDESPQGEKPKHAYPLSHISRHEHAAPSNRTHPWPDLAQGWPRWPWIRFQGGPKFKNAVHTQLATAPLEGLIVVTCEKGGGPWRLDIPLYEKKLKAT